MQLGRPLHERGPFVALDPAGAIHDNSDGTASNLVAEQRHVLLANHCVSPSG
jgi:hypothetical protein